MKPSSNSEPPPPSSPSAELSTPHRATAGSVESMLGGERNKSGDATIPPPATASLTKPRLSTARAPKSMEEKSIWGVHPPTHLSRQSCRSTKVDGNVVPPRSAKSAVPPKGIPPSNILTIGKTAVPLRSTETLFHHGSVSRGTISAFLPAPKDSLYTSI